MPKLAVLAFVWPPSSIGHKSIDLSLVQVRYSSMIWQMSKCISIASIESVVMNDSVPCKEVAITDRQAEKRSDGGSTTFDEH